MYCLLVYTWKNILSSGGHTKIIMLLKQKKKYWLIFPKIRDITGKLKGKMKTDLCVIAHSD
jgi:hypothetical protein